MFYLFSLHTFLDVGQSWCLLSMMFAYPTHCYQTLFNGVGKLGQDESNNVNTGIEEYGKSSLPLMRSLTSRMVTTSLFSPNKDQKCKTGAINVVVLAEVYWNHPGGLHVMNNKEVENLLKADVEVKPIFTSFFLLALSCSEKWPTSIQWWSAQTPTTYWGSTGWLPTMARMDKEISLTFLEDDHNDSC